MSNNNNSNQAAASKKKSSDLLFSNDLLLVTSPTAGFAPASRGGGAAMETATSSTASSSKNVGAGENGGQSSTTAAANIVAAAASSPAPPASAAATAASSTTKASKAKTTKKRSSSKRGSNNSTTAAAASLGGSLHSLGGGSGGGDGDNNNNSNYNNQDTTITPLPATIISSTFTPLSLSQIQLRIKLLLDKLPDDLDADVVPDDYDAQLHQEDAINNSNNKNNEKLATIKQFASNLQQIIEEYNLLLSLVSSSTYQWGVDRSGASQQNLSVMSSELQQCQEVLTSVVSGRLSNVLCPAVDVLIGSVEIVRGDDGSGVSGGDSGDGDDFRGGKKRKLDGSSAAAMNVDSTTNNSNSNMKNEQRINHYTRPLVDPSYVHLCHQILARNSSMIRYTVATCIHTAQRVIGDYLHAMKKDVGHEVGKGGYY
jgi:hypothetical protein